MADFYIYPTTNPTKCSFRIIEPRSGTVWDQNAGAMATGTTVANSIVLCGTDGTRDSAAKGFAVNIPAGVPKGAELDILFFDTDAPVAATVHTQGFRICKTSSGKVVFTDSKLY